MPPSSSRSQRSPTELQNLNNIIDSATPDRLRALLKKLATTVPENFTYIQGELMLQHGALKRAWSENDEADEDSSDDSSEDTGDDYESEYSDEQTDAPASRQRFEICTQCNEEYDVLCNDKKSCEWHDEVDWDGDFWADHDERCHGTIDTAQMRKENPQGFVWDCCDELGDAAGCKTSRHRPNRAKRVRR